MVRVVQYTKHFDPDEWKTMALTEDLHARALALAPGEHLNIGSVRGLPTMILNKPWRGYSMHQQRIGGGKSGVRIFEISPQTSFGVPSIDLEAGCPFSFVAPHLQVGSAQSPPPPAPLARSHPPLTRRDACAAGATSGTQDRADQAAVKP